MDTPGYDPVGATGQVAGGCNVMCFTTGRGSAFGCKPTPSIKLATNKYVYRRMTDDMDINCGDVLDGIGDRDQRARRFSTKSCRSPPARTPSRKTWAMAISNSCPGKSARRCRELRMSRDKNARARLRSQFSFDNPDNPGMTALYLERYLNYGLTRKSSPPASRSSASRRPAPICRPAIVITSNWPSACAPASARPAASLSNFRCIRLQETGKRPTAALDRNLAYLGLVGSSVRLSARRRGADHRLRQDHAGLPDGGGERQHSGHRALRRTDAERLVEGRARRLRHGHLEGTRRARRRPDQLQEFIDIVTSSAPSVGHCNTMGTASTMNALAEALGMSLPGCAAIPAPYRERGQIAYDTGLRAVEIVPRSSTLRHSDPQGVREHHRRLLGDRRFDQCADPAMAVEGSSRDYVSRGQRLPSSVTLQGLINGGYISAGEVRTFDGLEVAMYPTASTDPQAILVRVRMPDGVLYVTRANSSTRQELQK